jgi:hypothetical protein
MGNEAKSTQTLSIGVVRRGRRKYFQLAVKDGNELLATSFKAPGLCYEGPVTVKLYRRATLMGETSVRAISVNDKTRVFLAAHSFGESRKELRPSEFETGDNLVFTARSSTGISTDYKPGHDFATKYWALLTSGLTEQELDEPAFTIVDHSVGMY